MIAIQLRFLARRWHATPWGRQVNEGAVEWPPSPWRLLRSLLAVWHLKFSEIEEAEVRELIEALADPPNYSLPAVSQGHTRHYMPQVNGDKTKIFDTFISIDEETPVVAAWPNVVLTAEQRELLSQLLRAMTYFGRAESWVEAELVDSGISDWDCVPMELGEAAPEDFELVRTLTPVSPTAHEAWYQSTRAERVALRLKELAAKKKGKAANKLSPKDEQAIDRELPATLFEAMHADTAALRRGGWNYPPGSRWIHYTRRTVAFSPQTRRGVQAAIKQLPTVARFAVVGTVRPKLTEALLLGEHIRLRLMGSSKNVDRQRLEKAGLAVDTATCSSVFSGKTAQGEPRKPKDHSDSHAYVLCEAVRDYRINYATVYAPQGFRLEDERALQLFAESSVAAKRPLEWEGHKLQFVLMGIGQACDFGGKDERSGEAGILAESRIWVSRTPLVLNRHLKIKRSEMHDPQTRWEATRRELIRYVRRELSLRPQLAPLAEATKIEPLLERNQCGTRLGDHFTSWHKFRRQRVLGGGTKASNGSYGFRLIFPEPVIGPIVLGYGSHFGLGQFTAE